MAVAVPCSAGRRDVRTRGCLLGFPEIRFLFQQFADRIGDGLAVHASVIRDGELGQVEVAQGVGRVGELAAGCGADFGLEDALVGGGKGLVLDGLFLPGGLVFGFLALQGGDLFFEFVYLVGLGVGFVQFLFEVAVDFPLSFELRLPILAAGVLRLLGLVVACLLVLVCGIHVLPFDSLDHCWKICPPEVTHRRYSRSHWAAISGVRGMRPSLGLRPSNTAS